LARVCSDSTWALIGAVASLQQTAAAHVPAHDTVAAAQTASTSFDRLQIVTVSAHDGTQADVISVLRGEQFGTPAAGCFGARFRVQA
jgi:hypothetical protein